MVILVNLSCMRPVAKGDTTGTREKLAIYRGLASNSCAAPRATLPEWGITRPLPVPPSPCLLSIMRILELCMTITSCEQMQGPAAHNVYWTHLFSVSCGCIAFLKVPERSVVGKQCIWRNTHLLSPTRARSRSTRRATYRCIVTSGAQNPKQKRSVMHRKRAPSTRQRRRT